MKYAATNIKTNWKNVNEYEFAEQNDVLIFSHKFSETKTKKLIIEFLKNCKYGLGGLHGFTKLRNGCCSIKYIHKTKHFII